MRKRILLIMAALSMALAVISQVPTKQQFFDVCDSLSIHHPNVVWAQARLESGNFTSAHFKNRNNCLGIYDSKNKRYASFESWIHCLVAYRDKVQYKCKDKEINDDQYIDWLISIKYAGDPSYKQKVKKML